MTPEQALAEARSGALRPVYVVAGEEQYLRGLVLAGLRRAALGEVPTGLNDDQFDAQDSDVERVLGAARTLPMFASRRWVLLRGLERWEPRAGAEARPEPREGSRPKVMPLDRLADYAAAPSPSTTLVLVGDRLDQRRRLVTLAKKEGFLVDCAAPSRAALPGWLDRRARERGKSLAPGVGELLAEIAGPELARLDDAVERLALFVGDRGEIDEDAVGTCIVGVKTSSVWELTAAVARRDLGAALVTLSRVYDPRDRGLPLLGTLAWSTRQLIRFQAATAAGASPPEAAKAAGAPPFKAQELARQAAALRPAELERWLVTLSRVDLALKGGSRRSPQAVLESALVSLAGAPRGRGGRPGP